METTTPNGTTEHTTEKTEPTPSKALLMDWETAMHRAKALFGAIRAMGNHGLGEDGLGYIIDLAALGEAIVEDQMLYQSTQNE